jgi:hypothetical protein
VLLPQRGGVVGTGSTPAAGETGIGGVARPDSASAVRELVAEVTTRSGGAPAAGEEAAVGALAMGKMAVGGAARAAR